MKRWAANCNSVEEVLDLMAMDHISKLMPRQITTWVRDRSPVSFDEATTWADDFINNRGWNWDVLSEDEHWKRKPFRQDEQYQNFRERFHPPTVGQDEEKSTQENQEQKEQTNYSGQGRHHQQKMKSKYDPVKGPRYFQCNEYGHYASDYSKPRKREGINLAQCIDEGNILSSLPADTEEILVSTEVSQKVVMDGHIGETPISRILIDTGADRTIVRSNLVPEEARTGESVSLECLSHDVLLLPLAIAEVEVAGRTAELKVALTNDLAYNVVLGTNFPYIWDVGREELYKGAVAMVRTQAQTKANKEAEEADVQKDTDSGAQITSWNDDEAQAEAEVDDSLLTDF